MASPEEIAPLLPETLPEDFSDWDSEASPVPLLGDSGKWEAWAAAHSFGETPKPLGQSAGRDAISSPVVDRPRVSGSAPSAPLSVKQQRGFDDWDGEASPRATPINQGEWEAWVASLGKPPKPFGQSADRDAILSPTEDRPRDSGSAASVPVSSKQQRSTSELVDVSPSPASQAPDASHAANEVPVGSSPLSAAAVDGTSDSPELKATSRHDADAGLIQLFRTQNIEVEGERKATKKKRMIVVAISAGWIVIPLCIIIPLLHHGAKAAAKQSVQPPPVASDTQLNTKPPAPPASEPSTQDKLPATTERHQTTDNQPAQEEEGVNSAQLQTKMMHDQLTAPTQISEDAKKQVAENGPPPASIGAAGAEGLGGNGAIDRVFDGHAQPAIKVIASKPLAISSGVAAGMLIKMTPPIYPTVARAARVSGTVVLKATISKDGTIGDLHVVNGPQMLQHAALDAVRTWRYKPYKLNNEPTEVETTIDVVFTLGG